MASWSTPAVIFPDVKAWATAYVRAALAARTESFASDVTVMGRVPDPRPARLVTIRDDGGPRSAVTKTVSLGVNVWAATEKDCGDLAALVVAILEASAGVGAVVAHTSTFGPAEVAESSGQPHRYASVDLVVRGTAL